MGKVIESPIKEFPGTVTLLKPVPYSDFIAWEKNIQAAQEALNEVKNETVTQGESEAITWKAIAGMVKDWKIEGYDVKNPTADPRVPVINLMSWLVREIGKVINGDGEFDKKK